LLDPAINQNIDAAYFVHEHPETRKVAHRDRQTTVATLESRLFRRASWDHIRKRPENA
jgi:hypothetical protein